MSPPPRVVLVTGASSGIGRAVAHGCAARGDHLVLVARGEDALHDTARECDAAGAASTLVAPSDVGDDEAVARCVARTLEAHGRVDSVAHCAGVVAYGRTEDVPVEVFDGVLRTNLNGSANVARHVLPVMREQQHGSVVLIGSVIGHVVAPTMGAYVVSKWGVRGLARQLQVENRDLQDVHISYIAPGGVDTPIYEQAANYAGHVGRPPPPVASPESVAATVLACLDRPRRSVQVGLANHVMRLGFGAVPWAYDALVGPLFRVMATDRTRPVGPTPGNVASSQAACNRLHGGQGSSIVGIGRNLAAVVTSLGRNQA